MFRKSPKLTLPLREAPWQAGVTAPHRSVPSEDHAPHTPSLKPSHTEKSPRRPGPAQPLPSRTRLPARGRPPAHPGWPSPPKASAPGERGPPSHLDPRAQLSWPRLPGVSVKLKNISFQCGVAVWGWQGGLRLTDGEHMPRAARSAHQSLSDGFQHILPAKGPSSCQRRWDCGVSSEGWGRGEIVGRRMRSGGRSAPAAPAAQPAADGPPRRLLM